MKHGRRINTMNIPDDVDINYDSEPDDVEQKLSNKKYILDNEKFNHVVKRENDFDKTIQCKKKEIKVYAANNLGMNRFTGARKPSPLQRLESGFKGMFFSVDSEVLRRFPGLRKEVIKTHRKKNAILNTKIDLGHLAYFYLKDVNNTQQARINSLKGRKLKQSSNYSCVADKDIYELEFQKLINKFKYKQTNSFSLSKGGGNNSTIKSSTTNIHESNNNSNSNCGGHNSGYAYTHTNVNTSTNANDDTLLYSKHKPKLKLIDMSKLNLSNVKTIQTNSTSASSRKQYHPLIIKDSSRKNHSLMYNTTSAFTHHMSNSNVAHHYHHHQSQSPRNTKRIVKPSTHHRSVLSMNPTSKRSRNTHHLNLHQSIVSNANALETHTSHLENELYKIIDSQQYLKTMPVMDQNHRKDFEEMYGLKVNKQSEKKAEAKKQVLEAIQIRGQYRVMDKDKADFIKFSDDITKLPDEVALVIAERIVNAYNNQSDKLEKVTNKYGMISDAERERKMKMRERLDNNFRKIKRLGVYLERKEIKIKSMLQKQKK